MMPQKWRGIKTTPISKYEDKAKTITNRLKQKSISLPRIDDGKRWSGYAGLAGTAKKLAALIPTDCRYYVETFAGTAKVYQELSKRKDFQPQEYILNDKSRFIVDWLLQNFATGNTKISMQDFTECINTWDSENTVFLIDPPWFRGSYDQTFSCFDRPSVKTYDTEIVNICKKIQGKFIITSRKENKIYLQSGFSTKLVKSVYVVSGKYPKVLVTTNIDFKKTKS